MLAAKTFIGERLDLQHYKGIPVIGFELDVYDANDDPFDFTGYSRFAVDLFYKPHGLLIESFDLPDPSTNIIIVNANSETLLGLRPTLYYYEVYAFNDKSPAEKVLINYGIFDLI